MVIEYYTDGACTLRKVGNEYLHGPGGWGYVKLIDGEYVSENSDNNPSTTNNAMELQAINAALKDFTLNSTENDTCNIYTDSAYSLNIYTQWAKSWEKNGWTRGKKHEKIENLDVIKDTWNMLKNYSFGQIEFVKVKGHSGNEYNEMVDKLAVMRKSEVENLS